MPPQKVAILGAGPAGLAAAFELSEQPANYDVTVYTQGWRIGGKCASSHGANGRNEEHGLHVWFGCYENSFALYERVYQALPAAQRPYPSIHQAFTPRPYTVLGAGPLGSANRWDVKFPIAPGTPGDGAPLRAPDDAFEMAFSLFCDLVEEALTEAEAGASTAELFALKALRAEFKFLVKAFELLRGPDIVDELLKLGAAFGGLRTVDRVGDLFARVFDHALRARGRAFQLAEAADVLLAVLLGLLDPTDNAMKARDLDRLDKYEFSAWLRMHGLRSETLQSAFVRAVYECMFAYDLGDRAKPVYPAGVAVRVIFRIGLTFKGSVLYVANGGFGELLMVPAYQALVARGVKFEFFHRLTRLDPTPNGQGIGTITLAKQASVLAAPYQPLVNELTRDFGSRPVWPKEPLWAQLAGGVPATPPDFESYWCPDKVGDVVLTAGTHFDRVVLAVPATALREVCAPISAIRPRWRAMLESLRPVPNLSAQVWMTRSSAQLGWSELPGLDAGPAPQSVWTDMTQTLGWENWPAPAPVSVHYLCGVMASDLCNRPASASTTQAEANALARRLTMGWLEREATKVWPLAAAPGNVFDWSVVHDPLNRVGAARIDACYIRANVDPSEVTHLSQPGATDLRMYAGDTGFDNLVVAGDWVRTGLNSAAVEAAIMGGRQAARALMGASWPVAGEDWMAVPNPTLGIRLPSPLPPYISRIGRGEQSMPTDGVMTNAEMAVFVVKGKVPPMQALVDQWLNAPCGQPGRFTVASDEVMVSFMQAKMSSSGAAVGWLPDGEAAFWMAVRDGGQLRFWMPTIVVDTSIAMVTGREIWGFAKELGRVQSIAPNHWAAWVTGFTPLSAATQGQEALLAEVVRTANGPLGGLLSSASALAGALVGTIFTEVFSTPQPQVLNLKQFRDAADPSRAAFQSIVQSPFAIDDVRNGNLLGGSFELRIPQVASHNLAADFGLGPVNPVQVGVGFTMDFRALAGVELWRSR